MRQQSLAAIFQAFGAGGVRLISVDGMPQSGKSTLAREICVSLGISLIECDNYIAHGQKFYPHTLDLDRLRTDLAAIHTAGKPVVVEGIMVSLVLQALSTRSDLTIYVRRRRENGLLARAELLDDAVSVESLLEEENEICRAAGISDSEPILARELIAYHKEVRPHANAMIIYETTFGTDDDG